MSELLAYLARALADHPEEVAVTSFEEDDGTTVLELQVAADDLGKVIGRRGGTVNALRAVMRAAATRHGGRVLVDIVEQPAPGPDGGFLRIDVFTLFPRWFDWFREQRHVRNALDLGHELATVDLRSASPLGGGRVDDTPYGGGAGMVIRVDVVEAALRARYGVDPLELPARGRVVALAASGRRFDDSLAAELAAEPTLALLCGRYEGFDERVHAHLASDVVSIGRYVLSGGELAAMVVCDAVVRKLPGALGHTDSAAEESFSPALSGRPEYPHYTRPPEWRGRRVPEVLLSGDHARVREWRLEQSRLRDGGAAGEKD